MSTDMNLIDRENELFDEASNLPYRFRRELVERLLETLELSDEQQREIDRSWIQEARRRIEEYDAGRVTAIPGDEVMRQLRNRA